jgi:hypothetical protein
LLQGWPLLIGADLGGPAHGPEGGNDIIKGSAGRHGIGLPYQRLEVAVRQISWCSTSVPTVAR